MNAGTSSSTAEVAKRKESDCPQATGSGSWGKRTTLSKREPPSPAPLTSRREGPPTNYKCIANSAVCVEGAGAGAGWVSSVMTMRVTTFGQKSTFFAY